MSVCMIVGSETGPGSSCRATGKTRRLRPANGQAGLRVSAGREPVRLDGPD